MASLKSWNLDQLKNELRSRPEVKSWAIHVEHMTRRERYFMLDGSALAVDQDRETRSESISLKLALHKSTQGRQGEILKKLDLYRPLAPQLEDAIAAARQTDHQAWELPAVPQEKLPELKSCDPSMAEDLERVVSQLTGRISEAALRKRDARFNSAELALSVHDTELWLSSGLKHRGSQSRVYVEAAYSGEGLDARGQKASDECLITHWAISSQDLDVEKLFAKAAERAKDSLAVSRPQSGKLPVVIDAEALAVILHGQLARLSAVSQYQKQPHLKVGEEIVPGAEGDLLSLTLDPHFEYGADTTAVSSQGVPQKPLKLVERNRVCAIAADAQHSQYLGIEPTTVRGTLVVEPGSHSVEALRQAAPQVLEVLAFSSIFPSPYTGTFSSEIRLARLHDNVRGTVTWIKGGSVSGSVRENFKRARLSSETARFTQFSAFLGGDWVGEGYFGPSHALLSDVSVVG